MGTYCRGCGAMWCRKDYIDEPKPKPWIGETPKPAPPPASAPPLDHAALQYVQPQPYQHGVISDHIVQNRELGTLHNILRVLLSIESLLRRQEGITQTIVGQRLARMEDRFDNISGAAEHIEGLLEEIHEVVHGAVYDESSAMSYAGAFRVYNENA